MDRSSYGRLVPALRLALALPLVCAVLIGSLWVGQQLQAFRSSAGDANPSPDPTSQAAAGPEIAQQPIQFIDLPPGVTTSASGTFVPSPDGAYLIGRTTDFTRLAIIHVSAARDALSLRSELAASIPDVSFVAWMPDGRSFIAQGTVILNATLPPSGTKLSMKTFDVFRVDLVGTKTKLGIASVGGFALSPDGKLLAAFDGDSRLVAIRTDGGGTQSVANDPTAGTAPAFLGWDASGAIVRADYREPFSLHRIPLTGQPSDVSATGTTGVSNARWSPDHLAAIVTVSRPSERDGLLTTRVVGLPVAALAAWIGPHMLLTRGADEHAGAVDVLTDARTTFNAKLRSDKIRVLAVSLPYVLWLDEAKGIAHLLDTANDRDTGVGLSPAPSQAAPLTNGRFLIWRDGRLILLDGAGWWQHNVPATPSPIPPATDQTGVPAGFVRVESPEGGWSVVMPTGWYRREAPMHGSELLSYDPQGMDYSGNVPPAGEVRMVIQMPNDYGVTDLRAYVRAYVPGLTGGAAVKSEADLSIAGQPGYGITAATSQPPPFNGDLRSYFLRSPYFSDRVVSIQSSLARKADTDAIIASLRFFRPAPPPAATTTRAQVIAQYSKPTFSATRVDRVEAKLVRWKDYEKAVGTFRSGTNDPDELTWIVIVYGEIQPPSRGPCCRATADPAATPQTFRWELHAFRATGGFGGMYSCCGQDQSPPAWWDKLVDLAN